MQWVEVFTIIGVLGGFMFFMLQRLEKDIDKINSNIAHIDKRLDGHATRIDQLYKMFCDIQKEIKELHIDFITKERS
jgi:hypothetical protein